MRPFDRDENLVARLNTFGIVGKSGERENAFRLVADVDENLFGGEGDDGALDLLNAGCGFVGVALLELGEDVGEVFLRLGGLFGRGFCCGRARAAMELSAVSAIGAGAVSVADEAVCSLTVSGESEEGWDSGMVSLLMMSTVPLSHARPGTFVRAP